MMSVSSANRRYLQRSVLATCRVRPILASFFLLILANTCTALLTTPLAPPTVVSWEVATAVSTLEGLRSMTTTTSSKEKKLDLLTDLYDAETGLVSEGVWHNCMVGIACVKCSQRLRRASEVTTEGTSTAEREALAAHAASLEEWGLRLGSSLYDLNWAGTGLGFRRRTPGKLWEDASVDAAARERIIEDGENVAFYTESPQERRAVSNAAAVLLYTFLAELRPSDEALAARSAEVGDVFLRQFFDSASCRFRQRSVGDEGGSGGEGGGSGELGWRAVDQAMGVLAALRLTRAQTTAGDKRQAVRTRTMAVAAAEQLLSSSPVASPDGGGAGVGFGYGAYASEGRPPPVNRLPPVGNRRDSWADAICCFALLAADACSGTENPNLLLRATERDYQVTAGSAEATFTVSEGGGGGGGGGGSRLLAHQPIEVRSPDDDSGAANKCYTSTQGWWNAVQRAAGRGAAHLEDTLKPFHCAVAVVPPGGGNDEEVALGTPLLLPVSTQDSQVRLWANTEFAASLVLDYEDFCL